MRCFLRLGGILLVLAGARHGAAQTTEDTLPARVVEGMLAAFDRGDVAARSALYDSVYYFEDLAVPRPGDPQRPRAMTAPERAGAWQRYVSQAGFDSLPRRSRKVLQRMVVGRFVAYHIAVVFEPPHEDQSFEKLEIYEVKNGKIVAEYDGQYTASGSGKTAGAP